MMEMYHNLLTPCKQPHRLIDTILFLKFLTPTDVHKVGDDQYYELCKL